MSNKNRTTFYIGVTSNLAKRVAQHKMGIGSVFTKKYRLTELVYYELIRGMKQAINREKELKNWKREWKLNLIRSINPELKDISETGVDWLL
jgi:putative endonuclease